MLRIDFVLAILIIFAPLIAIYLGIKYLIADSIAFTIVWFAIAIFLLWLIYFRHRNKIFGASKKSENKK